MAAGSMRSVSSPLLLGIDRLVMRVPSLAAAVAFYRDTLGLAVEREEKGFAILKLPDSKELLLHTSEELPAEAVFLLVCDVTDLYRRREELRLKFAGKPTRVSRGFKATAKDPFGGVLLLIDRSLEASSGEAGEDARATLSCLFDHSSRPRRSPARLAPELEEAICACRRATGWGPRLVAGATGFAHSTVWKVLQRAGISRPPPAAKQQANRYEWPCPGDLLHMDVSRYARFLRPGHAVGVDLDDEDLVAGLLQFGGDVGADVSTAGDHDAHQ